jgi:enoyl-CoA hydratase/carnithine racemase
MSENILVEAQARVLTIRINRPDKKNALTQAMYSAMTAALRRGEAESSVRAILLTGTEECFTAGNDLADFASAPAGGPTVAIEFLHTLAAARKPVMAAVNGLAIGIGATLLLHCDLVYAGSAARFQFPFVNLGLCPEAASSLILPSLVGHRRAAELLYFGEPFGAEAARDFGIVNEIFPDAELLSSATAKALQLAEKPPAALRATKALLKGHTRAAVTEAMAQEMQQFGPLLQGPEVKEAIAAFRERRKPDFSRF